MSTALFQCSSQSVAQNMKRCLPVAPCRVLEFNVVGNLSCIAFDGDCASMYWWGMEISNQSPQTCAFIGIDERAVCFEDKYSLSILTGGVNSSVYKSCYIDLVEKFMDAALRMTFTEEQLKSITDSCVLGSYDISIVQQIVASINICREFGRTRNYRNLLMANTSPDVKDAKRDTLVRVMMHICYLDCVVRPNAGKAKGLLRFLFGS